MPSNPDTRVHLRTVWSSRGAPKFSGATLWLLSCFSHFGKGRVRQSSAGSIHRAKSLVLSQGLSKGPTQENRRPDIRRTRGLQAYCIIDAVPSEEFPHGA